MIARGIKHFRIREAKTKYLSLGADAERSGERPTIRGFTAWGRLTRREWGGYTRTK